MSRPTATGQHCLTADGTRCRVTYIGGDGLVELSPLEGGPDITLPIGELRRVARRRRPPIQDMPAERPLCAWCERRIAPWVDEIRRDDRDYRSEITRRLFKGWRTVAGAFCTNRCAIAFARAAYRGGFRRTR